MKLFVGYIVEPTAKDSGASELGIGSAGMELAGAVCVDGNVLPPPPPHALKNTSAPAATISDGTRFKNKKASPVAIDGGYVPVPVHSSGAFASSRA